MITTIDDAGRLVIPKAVRREAGIEPGVPLDVRWRDGVIEVEPRPIDVTLERRGRLLVAKPKGEVPALAKDIVDAAQKRLRSRGGG